MSRLFVVVFLFSSLSFAQQKIDFDLSKVKSAETAKAPNDRVPLADLSARTQLKSTRSDRAVVDPKLQNSFEDRRRYEESSIQLYKWERLEGTPFEVGAGLNRARVGFYPYRRVTNRAEISLRIRN